MGRLEGRKIEELLRARTPGGSHAASQLSVGNQPSQGCAEFICIAALNEEPALTVNDKLG
jgi:hypothetical protein